LNYRLIESIIESEASCDAYLAPHHQIRLKVISDCREDVGKSDERMGELRVIPPKAKMPHLQYKRQPLTGECVYFLGTPSSRRRRNQINKWLGSSMDRCGRKMWRDEPWLCA
jgi:hypothetical protein